MDTNLDLDTLRNLLAEVVDMDAAEIPDNARFIEDIGMDSLMALEILVALEKRYKVKLKEDDLKQLNCLVDVQRLLAAKLGERV